MGLLLRSGLHCALLHTCTLDQIAVVPKTLQLSRAVRQNYGKRNYFLHVTNTEADVLKHK